MMRRLPAGLAAVFFLAACCQAAPLPPGRPKERAVLEGHLSLTGLAFSPDGKSVATCGLDGAVKLWDVGTGRCTATLKHRGRVVQAVVFSPDGNTLASYDGNREAVQLWDLKADEPRASACTQMVGTGITPALAFTPQGKLLFASREYLPRPRVRVPRSATEAAKAGGAKGADVPPTPDNPRVFAVWDTDTGKPAFRREGRGPISRLAFSPDGKLLASGGGHQVIQIWDLATGGNTATTADRPGNIDALAFSPDGKILAAGFKYVDGEADATPLSVAVRLYETATGKVLATLKKGQLGPFAPLAFSPDGRLLATGQWDGKIILWDLPAAYAER
jgi:WD40 repeat protein